MKYKISLESLGLSDVVKKGRTVREDLLKEIKGARGKVSEVNWKRELETFRSNPLDAAQGYFNQLNEAIRTKLTAPEPIKAAAKKPAAKKPAAKKPAAKKPAAKKPAAKKPAAKKPAGKKTPVRKPVAKKTTTRSTSPKAKSTTKRTSVKKTTATRTRKPATKTAQ